MKKTILIIFGTCLIAAVVGYFTFRFFVEYDRSIQQDKQNAFDSGINAAGMQVKSIIDSAKCDDVLSFSFQQGVQQEKRQLKKVCESKNLNINS